LTRTGGQVVVDQLELNGVELAFCVPGESYLAVLDALHDSPIRLITARHEASAANMADAYGKLTGRPGICLVTRGPGSTQAAVGVHTARQDSTPLVLLVGQVPRRLRGTEAFQELDYPSSFGGIAKWAAEVDEPDALPELLERAFETALTGTPGPVVLSLPEDVLFAETAVEDGSRVEVRPPEPRPEDVRPARELLAAAERPLVVAAEGMWSDAAASELAAFAEASELPVAVSFRCQDYLDNRSRVYAGHLTVGMEPRLAERLAGADVVLWLGRLGDVATRGFTLVERPRPRQTLVHVHPDRDELGRVVGPAHAVVSAPATFLAAARAPGPLEPRWRAWTEELRAEYEATLRPARPGGRVDLAEIVSFVTDRVPDDAVLTSGAGNFSLWAHRFYRFRRYGTQLAPRSGAMGYGVPAALTVQSLDRARVAVCLAGDGDFLMSGSELATAAQYKLAPIVLVVNNGMLGTIRMHQERRYSGRVVGTDLVNPDFAAYARSFGAHGETVERTEEFEPAFERALASGLPAVLDLRVDPDAISPRTSITELRAQAAGA